MLAWCPVGAHKTLVGVLARSSTGFPVGVSVEVAQVRQLSFPELTVRFSPFLESREVHSWDSKGEGEGGGQWGLSAVWAFFKTELFIPALASAAER